MDTRIAQDTNGWYEVECTCPKCEHDFTREIKIGLEVDVTAEVIE